MNRFIIFLTGIFFMFSADAQVRYLPEDTVIFARFLDDSQQGDRDMIRTARFFMNVPYVGGTLEGNREEQLQINLREADCVTFAENVIALHLVLQSDHRTFANFCRILQLIRYRNGIIDGYLSRLHYVGEWLANNEQKGIVSLPAIPGCQTYAPEVSFMSTHCDAYPALKAYPDRCKTMGAIETNINELRLCYIPKEQVKNFEANIRNGDIIAITTHIKGLDIAHMGFALVQNNRAYLLHASSEKKKVIVSDATLHDYLARWKNHSGIIVARMK
jgi:hypothetical protein